MSTTQVTGIQPRPQRALLLAAAILCAVSAVAAVVSGILWAVAANDDSIAFAAHRDQALQDGEQEIVNFNTLDYHTVQQGLQLWIDSSTGALRTEVQQGRNDNAARITQAKSKTTAQVVDAAVTELDDRAGQAKMIAVVKVTVTLEGQQPTVKELPYQAALTRENGRWKLSALG